MRLALTKVLNLMLIALVCAPAADKKEASLLPDGEGKEIAGRVCIECHDSGNFRKARLTGDEWSDSVQDMVERGAKLTSAELDTLVAYLTTNFGQDAPVRINTAPFAEIKAVLGFTVPETRAIIDYREKNGGFKDIRDLLRVPGIDAAKADAQKSRMAFQP